MCFYLVSIGGYDVTWEFLLDIINGHATGTDLLEVPTIYKAYVSGLCFRAMFQGYVDLFSLRIQEWFVTFLNRGNEWDLHSPLKRSGCAKAIRRSYGFF